MNKQCLENIEKLPPPENRPCSPYFCFELAPYIMRLCKDVRYPPNEPIICWDPNLNGPGKGGVCCCCCGGVSEAMAPVEVTPGEFALTQDLDGGDEILAAGEDLQWRAARIESSMTDVEPTGDPSVLIVHYQHPGESVPRSVQVASDQLLITPARTLIGANALKPGRTLLAADGKTVTVIFVGPADATQVRRIAMEGAFDGTDLRGHLINLHGLVAADNKVQIGYASRKIAPRLIEKT